MSVPQLSPMGKDFLELFNALSAGQLEKLERLYAADACFIDPLHQLQGLPAIKNYFAKLYQRVSHCRFELLDCTGVVGNEVISWRMTLHHPRLAAGRAVVVEGCSWIKYEQQIYYHRDFFDMGAMLYEQLPLLGGLLRTIKGRVSA